MTVYTDLFNEAIDDLAATLTAVTGLRVVFNPEQLNPPCVFIDAPDFEALSSTIAKMSFSVKVLTLGPGNLDGLRNVLSMCALLLASDVAVKSGRPGYVQVGSQTFASYDLTVDMQAQGV